MGKKVGMLRYADSIDRLLLTFGILSSIIQGMMSPLLMFVLSGLFNSYGNTGINFTSHVVDKYSLKLLYMTIGGGVNAFIEGVTWTRTAERQTSRMRMEYLKSVLNQEVGFFDCEADSSSTFKVISSISTDAILIQDVIGEKIPNFLASISELIFFLLASFVLSWRIALASFPTTLLFIIPAMGIGTLMMSQGNKMKDEYEVAGGIAEQAISSIRTVYSYVGERQTVENFNQALQRCSNLGIKQGLTKGILIGSMATMYAAWICVAWVGSILVTEKGEKGGNVFIAGTNVILAGLSVMQALGNISSFTDGKAAALRISEVIDRTPTIDSTELKGEILDQVKGEIEFKEVDFSYPSRPDTKILQGFNLKVLAGETIGLVGSSGSGKSTVISLIERFYDPIQGNIFLDGYELSRLQLKWLRSTIGLVSQEPILFATSIRENILFGKDEASMELVISAAKSANAHNFIKKLPEGYDTQVGQFGIQLSGGQKQRIAIARALIRDPRILLLDEATSALDSESERVVQRALDHASQGRTTIIVAHRLTTIQEADAIMVIQSGRVIESGTHNELMQMKDGESGPYLRMVQLQQSAMHSKGTYPSTWSLKVASPHRPVSFSPIQTSYSPRSTMESSPPKFSPASSSVEIQSSKTDLYDSKNDEKLPKSSYIPPSQWHLLKLVAPEWKESMLACLGAAGFGATQPFIGYSIGSLISVYMLHDNSKIKSETRFYILIFLGLAVIHVIASILQHYDFAVMGEVLTKRVREKVIANVLTFEVGWFDKDENTSAAICARIFSEANMVRSLVVDRMSLLVEVFANASLSYALALALSWRLAIVLISLQPIIIGCFYSKAVLHKSAYERAKKAQNEGCTIASEAAVNHRTVTAFSSQERILRLFEVAMEGPKQDSIKHSWISGVGLSISQFFTAAFVTFSFWYGGILLNQGSIESEYLFQVFFILINMSKSIADAGSMATDLTKGAKAVGSLFGVIDRKTIIEPEDPAGIKVEKRLKGCIELKKVYFSYPSRPDQMIFKGLNLKIEAGKTMALVGQSGSGKSTIIGLIERFYDPIKGSILIDEYDIKSYNLRTLRSQIALVSQEPTLFAGTIRQNILYGKQDATETELREASSLANAAEFISSMKDGYETYCGERGVQLSGGQKQRIALARAILKNPAILLLDEATSALDSVSEKLLKEALEKLMVDRTCVVIAHKLSTIQKSDCIAVMNNGEVVEQGSHSDLLAKGNNGSYYSLMKLQLDYLPRGDPKST